VTDGDERSMERFLYREARLADEHDYAGWEALWTDDGIYWVPAAGPVDDPTRMAIIHDNRHRISTRVRQLETGRRYAQAPPSRLRRVVSNIETVGTAAGSTDVHVEANFVLLEARETGTETWGGRVEYHLRSFDDGWRMSFKRVDLVNRPWVVATLGFVI
jgi:benzoate/toluate 1,2-dioxygenase subunit beta